MKFVFVHKMLALGGMAVAAALAPAAAVAQDYPNRPIRIVVGYGSGGSPDAVARLFAGHLSTVLGQAVIVENKVGASGSVASAFVATAPADGYTLLLAETGQNEIAPQMVKVPYDPVDGFTHLGQVTRTPLVIVTHTKGGKFPAFQSFQEVLATAAANPGKINFGTSGIGSGQHLAWEVLADKAGVKMTHVPYKGATQFVPAILSGEVELVMGTYGSFEQHIKAGTMRPLAVASDSRLATRPEIPHVAEFVKGYEDYSSEIGLMAPRGLPPDIHRRLTEAVRAALDAPDVRGKLDSLGLVRHWATPAAYRQSISQNQRKYKQAITLSGVKPQ